MLKAKVTIVGLGLMGGSLALGLRLAQRVALNPHATHLTVVDANPETRRAAERLADVVTADFAAGVREAAAVSHLPYVVAGTLMRTAFGLGDERTWTVSASGFRDTARVAGTDPRMMLDILLTNRTAVLAQLQRYQSELTEAIRLVRSGDEAALAAWLGETQREYPEYRTLKDER
ncbi:MAG: prephenate dehydrogenase [Chloroflexi bacterium]|nr:prephenate dehydrogenase [Chloroflexota bacterium]